MAKKKNCKYKLSYIGQTKPEEPKTNIQPKPSGQHEMPKCNTSSTVCPLRYLTRVFLYPLTGKVGGTKSEMGVKNFKHQFFND